MKALQADIHEPKPRNIAPRGAPRVRLHGGSNPTEREVNQVTRKDYILIAAALRDSRMGSDEATPETDTQWTNTVNAIARALRDDSGYDINGNRRFDRSRFMKAALS
jgi:hypothetical protein